MTPAEVRTADVARVRSETRARRKFYSPEELIEAHPFPAGSRPDLIEEAPQNEALEGQLLAESLSDLAKDAMVKGDAVKGAKLFYAEKTACATCHDSKADYQLGPELTLARKDITPEHLIKSILQPSADILKGYQTVNVITAEGSIVSGFLVEETDDKVKLSISTEMGKEREILQDDIEDLIESKVSTMPSGIVKFLRNREEFLDLTRFVLEVNQGGKKKLKELKQKAKVQSK